MHLSRKNETKIVKVTHSAAAAELHFIIFPSLTLKLALENSPNILSTSVRYQLSICLKPR